MKRRMISVILALAAAAGLTRFALAADKGSLAPGSAAAGSITSENTFDIYAIEVNEGGRLTVSVTPEMSVNVAWVDSSGNAPEGTSEVATALYRYESYLDVKKGTYYLKISMFDHSYTGNYAISTSFAPESEPQAPSAPTPTPPPVSPTPGPTPYSTIMPFPATPTPYTPTPHPSSSPIPQSPAPSAEPSPSSAPSTDPSSPPTSPTVPPSDPSPSDPSPAPDLAGYTVRYDANGGSGAPAAQTKTHGENLTLTSAKPAYADHYFRGWTTDQASRDVQYRPGAAYTLDADLTLYAVWDRLQPTGILVWPVPLFAALGILLLTVGAILRGKKGERNT